MWAWLSPCPHCFLSSTLRHSSIIFQSLMVIEPFFNIYLYHYNICTYQCHYMCGSIHYYNKCIFYP